LADVFTTEIALPGAVLVTSRRDELVDSRPSSVGSQAQADELVRGQLAFLMWAEPTRELMSRMTARRSFSGKAMTC
jgi:hypothetical protein